MAKELPYFKFFVSEWNDGRIVDCSLEAQGLFINLCSLYWSRLGALDDATAMRRLCHRNAKAYKELKKAGVLKVFEERISIDFLDEQLGERKQVSEKARELALKRWNADAKALPTHSQGNADKTREEKEKRRKDKIPSFSSGLDFTLFWDKYEKKVGASDCKKKWDKLPKETQEKILVHLDVYVPATPDPTYRKNPATYLNQEAWNDEVIPAKEKTQLPRFL